MTPIEPLGRYLAAALRGSLRVPNGAPRTGPVKSSLRHPREATTRLSVIPHERSECRDLLSVTHGLSRCWESRSRQALRACGMTAGREKLIEAVAKRSSGLVTVRSPVRRTQR